MYELPTIERQLELKEIGFTLITPSLNAIGDHGIHSFVAKCLDNAPLYFWTIPSSLSGKYHPEWALGDGGLLRHTICGMYYVEEIAETYGVYGRNVDLALAASALHDSHKYGIDFNPDYSHMHPYLPRAQYKDFKNWMMSDEDFELIFRAVERHMGNIESGCWQTISGLKPESNIEKVVHLADYVASRSKTLFSFDCDEHE